MSVQPLIPPTQVDVRMIERELTTLWKRAAERPDESGDAVMRACVLNLVACAPTVALAERMSSTILRLMEAGYPNRAFVISSVPRAQQALLDVWVQAQCQLPAPGRPQVCSEQIRIDAHGSGVNQVSSIVLSLLLPDLPTMIWWPGPAPFDDPLFARLSRLADRLLLDSGDFVRPERDLARIVELLQAGAPLSDLAWARLTPWRELTAQFFDTRLLLPHLRRLDRVVLQYTTMPGQTHCTQSLLLAGWLASRLNWRLLQRGSRDGEIARIFLERDSPGPDTRATRIVEIELQPVANGAPRSGGPRSLTLQATDGVLASFAVERGDDAHSVRTHVDVAGLPPMRRTARLEQLADEHLLAEELRVGSGNWPGSFPAHATRAGSAQLPAQPGRTITAAATISPSTLYQAALAMAAEFLRQISA